MPNLFPLVVSVWSGVNFNLSTEAEPVNSLEMVNDFLADPDAFAAQFGDLAAPKPLEQMLETGEFGLPLVPPDFLGENPDDEEVGFDEPIAGTQLVAFEDLFLAFPQNQAREEPYLAWYCLVPLEDEISRLLEIDSGFALNGDQLILGSAPRIVNTPCHEIIQNSQKACRRGTCALPCRGCYQVDPHTGVRMFVGCRCPKF